MILRVEMKVFDGKGAKIRCLSFRLCEVETVIQLLISRAALQNMGSSISFETNRMAIRNGLTIQLAISPVGHLLMSCVSVDIGPDTGHIPLVDIHRFGIPIKETSCVDHDSPKRNITF